MTNEDWIGSNTKLLDWFILVGLSLVKAADPTGDISYSLILMIIHLLNLDHWSSIICLVNTEYSIRATNTKVHL